MERKGNFTLVTRSEFKIWLFGQKVTRPILKIQQHNTVKPSYEDCKGNYHFSLCEAMRNYHVNVKKWQDIAQHFTTFPDGSIMICRSLELNPAGIFGQDKNAICIEHVGYFDKEAMTEEQKKTAVFMTAMLCAKFKIKADTNSILYHHWFDLKTGLKVPEGTGTTKTCPGTGFFGGNTEAIAKKNFIPLVQKEIDNMSTTPTPTTAPTQKTNTVNTPQFTIVPPVVPPKVEAPKVETPKVIPQTTTTVPPKNWKQKLGEESIDILVNSKIIDNGTEWKAKDLENTGTPLWLTFLLIRKLLEALKK